MVDVKEKLFELIGKVQDCGCDVTDVVAMNYVENTVLIDHLIANGVTIPVRCKACEYWDEYHLGSLDGPGTGDGACLEDPNNWIDHRKANDFCSYGKRRTE